MPIMERISKNSPEIKSRLTTAGSSITVSNLPAISKRLSCSHALKDRQVYEYGLMLTKEQLKEFFPF